MVKINTFKTVLYISKLIRVNTISIPKHAQIIAFSNNYIKEKIENKIAHKKK